MKIAIMAGGTGGHIFPGIAVAEELLAKGVEVLWLGAKGGMEENIVNSKNIPLTLLKIKGLRGKGMKSKLLMPFKLMKSILDAMKILKKEKVNAVLSMGGYVAGPGGLAAKIKRIPIIVHEQNSKFGMTNRYLARWSTKTLTGFNLNNIYKSIHVGNPVRSDIERISRSQEIKPPYRIFILGGSLGAKSLNTQLPEVLNNLSNKHDMKILHQCGKGNKDQTIDNYDSQIEVTVKEFIDDMRSAYQNTDLIIARAGALTIAEINAVGLAAILIPYPYAVDDHQTTNAQHLVDSNAAIIWQENSDQKELEENIDRLLSDEKQMEVFAHNSKSLHKPNSAAKVAEYCIGAAQ